MIVERPSTCVEDEECPTQIGLYNVLTYESQSHMFRATENFAKSTTVKDLRGFWRIVGGVCTVGLLCTWQYVNQCWTGIITFVLHLSHLNTLNISQFLTPNGYRYVRVFEEVFDTGQVYTMYTMHASKHEFSDEICSSSARLLPCAVAQKLSTVSHFVVLA